MRARTGGFSIVEALVALVVLSVGMLGIAALYVESLRAGRSAVYHTQAVNLAADMADRIRANRMAGAAAWALAAFAIGLPAFVLIKVLQPGFFANEDTKTPMRYAGVNLVINAAGSLALFFAFKAMGFMPHVGIALATSIAAWVNAALLWGTLKRRGHFVTDNRLARSLPLIAVASVLMGAGVVGADYVLEPWLRSGAGMLAQASALAVLVAFGVVLFASIILTTGVMTPAQLRRKMQR